MNTNNVISADAAADLTGKEFFVVKLTSTGVNLAGAGDVIIGTLRRAQPHQEDGVYAGKSVAVQLWPASVHLASLGNSVAAVAKGDKLAIDPSNPGQLIPAGANPVVAIAFDAFTAAIGGQVSVIFTSEAGEGGGSSGILVPQAGTAQSTAAAATDLTTSEALANDLKAKYNALQAALVAAKILS